MALKLIKGLRLHLYIKCIIIVLWSYFYNSRNAHFIYPCNNSIATIVIE